jgi:hypothetical protein
MTCRSLRSAILAVGLVLPALAGCSGGESAEPTVAQAEDTLKTHITQMLETLHASDIKITDPGGEDVACGEGRVKRTYRATAVEELGSGEPDIILLAMIGALDRIAEYDAVGNTTDKSKREMKNDDHHTRITLESPGERQIVIAGETYCLTP